MTDRLKDIPVLARDGKNLSAVMEAVREVLQTFRGYRGDPLDKALTLRDATARNILLPSGEFAGSSVPGPPGPAGPAGPSGTVTPDLTAPPTATGLAVTAGLTSIYVECDTPVYTQGHGHDRTVVYGAKWPSGPAPTFVDAVELFQFQGTFSAYGSDTGTRWCIWIKWRSNDGVLSVDPAGGTNGVQATTGQDIAQLLSVLSNALTESELHSSLGNRIDLIDAPPTTTGSVNARLAQEALDRAGAISVETGNRTAAINNAIAGEVLLRNGAIASATTSNRAEWQNGDLSVANSVSTLSAQMRGTYAGSDLAQVTSGLLYLERESRVTQDNALANQIILLSAGVSGGFDSGVAWYFDSGVESWTGTRTTVSAAGGWLKSVPSSADPLLESPVISVPGSKYATVKARIRRTGTPVWEGKVSYKRTGDSTYDGARSKTVAEPTWVSDIAVVNWDFSGDALWTGGTIVRFTIEPTNGSTGTYEFDFIAVGREGPAASVAALADEATARANADSAEVSARQTLSAKLTGANDPSALTLGTLASGLLFEEKTARASETGALAVRATSLESSVNNGTTGLATKASIAYVDQTEVDAISAAASQTNLLRAQLATKSTAIFYESWGDPGALSQWEELNGAGEREIVTLSDASLGGQVLRIGNNSGNDQSWGVHKGLIPFDPSRLYRWRARVRRLQGVGTVYVGFVGVQADGTTPVNILGAQTYASQHYHGVSSAAPSADWVEYTGYTRGFGGPNGSGVAGSISSPAVAHPLVRYMRPLLLVNYNDKTGQTEVDYFILEDATADKMAIDASALATTKADATAFNTLNTQVQHGTTGLVATANRVGNLESSVNNGTTGLGTKASIAQVATAKSEAIAASALVTDWISARLNSGDIITAINTTTNTANAKSANFAQGTSPTATKLNDLWIDTDNGNVLKRWNGSAWVAADDTRIGSSASSITNLQSTVNNGTSGVAATYAALQIEASTRASQTGDLFAQYTVKLDVNGKVSGFGLASTGPTGAGSEFQIRADKFSIAAPTGAAAGYVPFTVLPAPQAIGGVTFEAGVYAQRAFLQDLQVTNAKIGTLAVDDQKIANLSAAKLTVGDGTVGGNLKSSNYVASTSGWLLTPAGYLEASNAWIRGTIYATAGQIGGITIASNAVRAGQTAFNTGSGFYLGADGKLSLGNSAGNRLTWDGSNITIVGGGTFSGALSAATGTFAGALSAATGSFAGSLSAATGSFSGTLSAATGTFAGSLSAASGTFAGTLTAAAVNAVNSINIANNAVTVSSSATGTDSSVSTNLYVPAGVTARLFAIASKTSGPEQGNILGAYQNLNVTINGNTRSYSTPPVVRSYSVGQINFNAYLYPPVTGAHEVEVSGPATITASATFGQGDNTITLLFFARFK